MRDSSVVRALARKARGPGFNPQLRFLNFSFLRPSVCAFFLWLVCWNGLIEANIYFKNLVELPCRKCKIMQGEGEINFFFSCQSWIEWSKSQEQNKELKRHEDYPMHQILKWSRESWIEPIGTIISNLHRYFKQSFSRYVFFRFCVYAVAIGRKWMNA